MRRGSHDVSLALQQMPEEDSGGEWWRNVVRGKQGEAPFVCGEGKMNHITFVIWALLWPLVFDLTLEMDAKLKDRCGLKPNPPSGFDAGMFLAVWIVVGILVY